MARKNCGEPPPLFSLGQAQPSPLDNNKAMAAYIWRRPVDLFFVSVFASFAVIAVTIGKALCSALHCLWLVIPLTRPQILCSRRTERFWREKRSSMVPGLLAWSWTPTSGGVRTTTLSWDTTPSGEGRQQANSRHNNFHALLLYVAGLRRWRG